MNQITTEVLKQKCNDFERREKRASYYDLARKIADEHFLQACVIIIAVWNTARFRMVKDKEQLLAQLEEALEKCKPRLEKMKNERIQDADLENLSEDITFVYNTLSKIRGVEYTGTSKIMHLMNVNLFVMWDEYIRKKYKIDSDAAGYLEFLKEMQQMAEGVHWEGQKRTLAKAIDEYNYMTISWPALKRKEAAKTVNKKM